MHEMMLAAARAAAVANAVARGEELNETCSRCRNDGDRFHDCKCVSDCGRGICPLRSEREACWLWNPSALALVPRFVH